MATLLLFGPARSAAGQRSLQIAAATVRDLCDEASRRLGPEFAAVLSSAAIWVNGEPATGEVALRSDDEVAVVPPVSGGA